MGDIDNEDNIKGLKDNEPRLTDIFHDPDNTELIKADQRKEHGRFGFGSRIALICGLNVLVAGLFQLPEEPSAGAVANLVAITVSLNGAEAAFVLGTMEKVRDARDAIRNLLLTLAPFTTSVI